MDTPLEEVAQVRFFPEGAKLLRDFNNKLIISAWDAQGYPVTLEGEIRDGFGRLVVDVQSYDTGLGMSILRPEAGASYTLHLKDGQRFPLPEVEDAGYSMRVNTLDPDHIKISIATIGMGEAPLQLRGRIGENVFLEQALEPNPSESLNLAHAPDVTSALRRTIGP